MMAGTLREWSFEWRQDHKTIRTKNGGIFPQAVFDGAGGIRSPTYKVAQLIRLCHRSG